MCVAILLLCSCGYGCRSRNCRCDVLQLICDYLLCMEVCDGRGNCRCDGRGNCWGYCCRYVGCCCVGVMVVFGSDVCP